MDINLGLFDLVYKNSTVPKKTKLIYYGTKISTDHFLDIVLKTANYLKESGVKKGDVVGIMLPNFPQTIFTLYGTSSLGAVANLIDVRTGYRMLNSIIKDTKTKVLFIFDRVYKKYKNHIPKDIKIILCSPYTFIKGIKIVSNIKALFSKETYFEKILKSQKLQDVEKLDGSEISVYIHSAGTTGIPKTVVLSSRAINAIAAGLRKSVLEADGVDLENDLMSMLMVLPISHGFGVGVCTHTMIANNMCTVLVPSFSPRFANSIVRKHKVTYLAGIPGMYRKMVNAENSRKCFASLRHAFCGGDRLDPKLKIKFDKVLQESGSSACLEEGYGLTEVVNVCCVNLDKTPSLNGIASQGKPIYGAEFKIKNIDASNDLMGELYVKTPAAMEGYLGDKETTEKTIVKDNGDVWVATGDMVMLDSNQNIYFIDRIKRSTKIGGFNVFPAQIEQVVSELEFIENCCAVRRKNAEGKSYIELLVVVKDQVEKLEKLIEKKILDNIMRYAVPKVITVVDNIKTTVVGKADYNWYETNATINRHSSQNLII